ncbi:MAG: hypothetical protein A3D96_04285 [Chlamydiae bacterium RIFCSPHIGHO2_12_FULL_44_59]|nr:MAG: hypothetical protein A2796_05775 [Chlamydiae bacterium RIFCSPHIGHO2_01_FULL_44_39]OGN57050.1 MAG: hypothetical protein A3C42_00195 [Chlamydiae bacterium RIFCSPHIGHO2_02_FULL_45_9]OGN60063.1 MAG: hypothetical protein A3D96_04285 [Chlamydiae bacterium RIFCSPHIGHO2_12_FULL_44_59]OGN66236.1 MAG: hypothetical protein A2978_06280 [Chlamydiae bacterium RIFCSPLOWO2_01_FULL_44_52]OGN68508.1 MAG: hypothetical protein A3I67_02230 [Chlamydiae bacterium RIFCSPLOWO2_02_FULL_45_22]OGN70135.1 MAG: hyp
MQDGVTDRLDFPGMGEKKGLGVLGINHKTAGLALREKVALAAANLTGEKAIFLGFPTVLLSTCNRTEIYFSGEDLALVYSQLLGFLRRSIDGESEDRVDIEKDARVGLLAGVKGVYRSSDRKGAGDFRCFEAAQKPVLESFPVYAYFGVDCFAHLCRVTAGLDSAIFGETEIQRQVKLAYRSAKCLSSSLHYAFQKALHVSKKIRASMQIECSSTLYNMLWQLASWENKRILLVGYSAINRGLISYLEHKGVLNLTLCSRSSGMERIHVVGREILDRWQEYDIIVCASTSQDYLIRGNGQAHHVIFDLSVPRGVDPDTRARIYNIEELGEYAAQHAVEIRKSDVEEILWEHVSRLQTHLTHTGVFMGCFKAADKSHQAKWKVLLDFDCGW